MALVFVRLHFASLGRKDRAMSEALRSLRSHIVDSLDKIGPDFNSDDLKARVNSATDERLLASLLELILSYFVWLENFILLRIATRLLPSPSGEQPAEVLISDNEFFSIRDFLLASAKASKPDAENASFLRTIFDYRWRSKLCYLNLLDLRMTILSARLSDEVDIEPDTVDETIPPEAYAYLVHQDAREDVLNIRSEVQ